MPASCNNNPEIYPVMGWCCPLKETHFVFILYQFYKELTLPCNNFIYKDKNVFYF